MLCVSGEGAVRLSGEAGEDFQPGSLMVLHGQKSFFYKRHLRYGWIRTCRRSAVFGKRRQKFRKRERLIFGRISAAAEY
jgi:hypothetical protein